jgi:hypothetical protein
LPPAPAAAPRAVFSPANMPVIASLTFALTLGSAGPAPELQAKVQEIFDDSCTMCHGKGVTADDAEGVSLVAPLTDVVRGASAEAGKPYIVPGDPDSSYLLHKMVGGDIQGEVMPLGDDPLPPEKQQVIKDWIAALPPDAGTPADGETGTGDGGPGDGTAAPAKGRKPFHGTTQIALPTTTTLGKRTLQYRIDHRFGRIGTERGAFGLDAGVSMAMGLAYGILDGWDVQLRRANSRKTWELGTKYIPVRQEDGMPVSFGGFAAFSLLRDFDINNRYVGDFQVMLSRLWFERWSTMLVLGYHLRTDHSPRPMVDFSDDTEGPVPIRDRRDTFAMGLASTVWLGKRRRWGLDFEYVLPIPDGADPNVFYYRGGDADPGGSKIGSWSVGGSLKTAKHFFQVFVTNNREITTNNVAPGGQSGNPFATEGVDSKNPFHKFNFFLGFNLGRRFSL